MNILYGILVLSHAFWLW